MGTTPSKEKSDIASLCVENFMIFNRYLGKDYPRDILFVINRIYHELYGVHAINVNQFGICLTYHNGNSTIGISRIKFG